MTGPKKYLFTDSDTAYSTKSTENDNHERSTRLFFSKYGRWTDRYKGKCAVKITDRGDSVCVDFPGEGPSFSLSFCQVEELLCTLIAHSTSEFKKIKL